MKILNKITTYISIRHNVSILITSIALHLCKLVQNEFTYLDLSSRTNQDHWDR